MSTWLRQQIPDTELLTIRADGQEMVIFDQLGKGKFTRSKYMVDFTLQLFDIQIGTAPLELHKGK